MGSNEYENVYGTYKYDLQDDGTNLITGKYEYTEADKTHYFEYTDGNWYELTVSDGEITRTLNKNDLLGRLYVYLKPEDLDTIYNTIYYKGNYIYLTQQEDSYTMTHKLKIVNDYIVYYEVYSIYEDIKVYGKVEFYDIGTTQILLPEV